MLERLWFTSLATFLIEKRIVGRDTPRIKWAPGVPIILKNLLLSAPPRNRWIDEKDTVRDKGLYETAKGSSSGYLSDSSKESDEITALLLAGANPNGFKDEVSLQKAIRNTSSMNCLAWLA